MLMGAASCSLAAESSSPLLAPSPSSSPSSLPSCSSSSPNSLALMACMQPPGCGTPGRGQSPWERWDRCSHLQARDSMIGCVRSPPLNGCMWARS